MKNFWDTRIGRFLYSTEANEYTAKVLERTHFPYTSYFTVAGRSFTGESWADTVKVEMNKKRYYFDIPMNSLPEIRKDAEIPVEVERGLVANSIISETFTMKLGGGKHDIAMYPCIDI